MPTGFTAIDALLLARQHVVCVPAGNSGPVLPEAVLQGLEVNLEQLGYALSTQLAQRLRTLALDDISAVWAMLLPALQAKLGGGQKHVPLLRHFPYDIPENTPLLRWSNVMRHYFQAPDQDCLYCHHRSTTHVLNPCQHVVCDHCFDGSNYSACPICGNQVDTASPFFLPSGVRFPGEESFPLKLLHLAESRDERVQALFVSLCERKQAISPDDRDALTTILKTCGAQVLAWLPPAIPVRENIALIFGTLLQQLDPALVMAAAQPFFNSATDVLRLIAAYSGADSSLQGEVVYRKVPTALILASKKYASWHRTQQYWAHQKEMPVQVKIRRFKVAKLSRALRRSLLGFLETLQPHLLTEDMLRHRSYWVWLGQFLHPHEYQQRFPQVAQAFAIVRKKAPDGTPAPKFSGFYARMEAALVKRDAPLLARILHERPGEFGRRIDLALRLATDEDSRNRVLAMFLPCAPKLSTPVLLTLQAVLPTRTRPAKQRLYLPKGQVSKCVLAPDTRAVLTPDAIASVLAAVEQALLVRFATREPLPHMIIDQSLASITAPFNERTASKAAIQLTRGSRLPLPDQAFLRLFLHWCQPKPVAGGSVMWTDLDLSVGFYDANWHELGVCTYYKLQYVGHHGRRIAYSSGDLTSAPYPDGASEFVDIDLAAAREEGIRYAVMLAANYSGNAFKELERAFAGLMYRDDADGLHFDPRTVALRFDLTGSNGGFLPLVIDFEAQQMHWIDAHTTGGMGGNNVANTSNAITTICPAMVDYFASGVRASMRDLALLHAASRGNQVWLRGEKSVMVVRKAGEGAAAFLARLRAGEGQPQAENPFAADGKVWAALDQGNITLAAGSQCYVLRPEVMTGTMAAADLLA